MAIISDFDSEDPGSIPGAASFFFFVLLLLAPFSFLLLLVDLQEAYTIELAR